MKLSVKTKPCLWDALIAAAIVLLAGACALAVWGGQGQRTTALSVVISVDGEEQERIELTHFSHEPVPYSANGYTLYVAATRSSEPDSVPGIRVETSDCPTQDCVHTGVITRPGQSIVCLPARMVIELVSESGDPSGVDAVIG